jgi:nitrate reductase molybdenum cofactor assembly chaperone NarJ/NarW
MRARTSAAERVTIFAAVSRLLQYPDEILLENLDLIGKVADTLPAGARNPIRTLVSHLATTPLLDLQAAYVETFDLKRRNCLYLTYRQTGDTRRRGMALWRFQDLYRKRGYAMNDGELPDYLPALLELAAEAAPGDRGPFDLLLEHQPEVAVLHRSLLDDGSPYANVIAALVLVLPKPDAEILEAARRLAEDGPPEEQVGIAPFVVAESARAGT